MLFYLFILIAMKPILIDKHTGSSFRLRGIEKTHCEAKNISYVK